MRRSADFTPPGTVRTPPSVSLDHCHAHTSRRRRRSRGHLPLYHARMFSVDPRRFAPRVALCRRPALIASISSGQPANDSRRATSIEMGATPAVRSFGFEEHRLSIFRFVRTRTHARSPGPSGRCRPRPSSPRHAGRQRRKACFQLRAFQPQQLKHTLSELELPRLLAPDLPSDRYSHDARPDDSHRHERRDFSVLSCAHFDCRRPSRPGIVISRHYLSESEMGNLRACCLPWKWQPFLGLPLRNRTLIPRHP